MRLLAILRLQSSTALLDCQTGSFSESCPACHLHDRQAERADAYARVWKQLEVVQHLVLEVGGSNILAALSSQSYHT